MKLCDILTIKNVLVKSVQCVTGYGICTLVLSSPVAIQWLFLQLMLHGRSRGASVSSWLIVYETSQGRTIIPMQRLEHSLAVWRPSLDESQNQRIASDVFLFCQRLSVYTVCCLYYRSNCTA